MNAVSSPCVKICVLDSARGICMGCGRTMREISSWPRMHDSERAEVKRDLGRRLKALRGRAS